MPPAYPLVVYRGDTYAWDFVLWSDVEKTQPLDLTDVEVKAEVRDRPSGSLIVPLALTVEANVIHATLDAAASSRLPLLGVWDLQLTFVTGRRLTILAGEVRVTADVTDSGPPGVMPYARVRLVA